MSETGIEYGKNYWVCKKDESHSEIYYSKYDKTLMIDNVDIDLIFNGTRFVGWFQGDLFSLNKKLIHRVIMERIGENTKGKVVDHINGNQRDNRRSNLRVATRSQNSGNRIGSGTSQYLGVYWHKQIKHWCTRIVRGGELKYIKTFKDELDGAQAYNTQIVKFCEFAPQNDLSKGYSNSDKPNRPRDFRKDKAKIVKEDNGVLEIYYPKYEQTTFIDKKYLWLLEGKTNHLIGNICGNYLQVTFKGKFWKFHRLIWILKFGEIPDDKVIDHVNRNSLDNRIDNLRLVSRSDNSRNIKRDKKYVGVIKEKYCNNKWKAVINHNGKSIHIGSYGSEIEAAKAYDKYCRENNLIANFNFPE